MFNFEFVKTYLSTSQSVKKTPLFTTGDFYCMLAGTPEGRFSSLEVRSSAKRKDPQGPAGNGLRRWLQGAWKQNAEEQS